MARVHVLDGQDEAGRVAGLTAALRQENLRLGAGDLQQDPVPSLPVLLVPGDAKAELLGVEADGPALVQRGQLDKPDVCGHCDSSFFGDVGIF